MKNQEVAFLQNKSDLAILSNILIIRINLISLIFSVNILLYPDCKN